MSHFVVPTNIKRTGIVGRWKNVFNVLLTTCCLTMIPDLAIALTMEQANATCRETVGRPIVQACMGGQGRGPDAEQRREACRAKASPSVRACTIAALNKAHGRANVAVAVDDGKTKKETIDLGNALPAGFVAPPRTIADITAVLDNEKPDPATLAKLKDEADDEPEKALSVSDLAEFYYDRGTARSVLGRNADAIADGEKGLGIAGNGGDAMLKQRIRGFVASQKQAVGDLKTAVEMFQQMIRETQNVRGMGGHIFIASRNIMQALILSGDIAQADGYLRRMQTYLTEVRTSGIPQKRAAYNLRGRGWEGEFESGRATIFEARGQYREAEASYRKAADYRIAFIPDLPKIEYGPKKSQIRQRADTDLLNAARMKAKQGRLAEAEVDARRRAAGAAEGPGQVQSADHALRHGSCRNSGRARPLCRCREADPLGARHSAHRRHRRRHPVQRADPVAAGRGAELPAQA